MKIIENPKFIKVRSNIKAHILSISPENGHVFQVLITGSPFYISNENNKFQIIEIKATVIDGVYKELFICIDLNTIETEDSLPAFSYLNKNHIEDMITTSLSTIRRNIETSNWMTFQKYLKSPQYKELRSRVQEYENKMVQELNVK